MDVKLVLTLPSLPPFEETAFSSLKNGVTKCHHGSRDQLSLDTKPADALIMDVTVLIRNQFLYSQSYSTQMDLEIWVRKDSQTGCQPYISDHIPNNNLWTQ